MQIESLEVLEKADVAPVQARAIVRAIEIEMARGTDTLATKNDIALLRQEFVAFRHEVTGSIAGLATRTELADMRGEMHALIGASTRQIYLAILGQMAVLLGFAYFFATHIR
jgi:hypothetical protein